GQYCGYCPQVISCEAGACFTSVYECVARSRQVCIYWLWKHCLFCRDCLWRERTSIYSWRLPWFAGNALYRLTGDAPSPRRRSPCASLAITLCLTGDHLVDDALSPY